MPPFMSNTWNPAALALCILAAAGIKAQQDSYDTGVNIYWVRHGMSCANAAQADGLNRCDTRGDGIMHGYHSPDGVGGMA